MWYVIQVTGGREHKACDLINRAARGERDYAGKLILRECFVPRYQVERKFHGKYRLMERVLFPGYVIAITSNVAKLNRELSGVPEFARLLGNGEAFIPLERNEAAFINSFTTEHHRVVHLSRAVSEGDAVTVVEGPMVGREGWITSIDRRKGTCRVETEAFGRMVRVEIGLAVVTKA